MSGAVPIARRGLSRQRLRLALRVGGVGMALLMILALDGLYSAMLDRVTAYPDNQGAPLIASQRGVSTMHMSSSTVAAPAIARLRSDPRVERAEPILYTTLLLGGRRRAVSYVSAFATAAGHGRSRRAAGVPAMTRSCSTNAAPSGSARASARASTSAGYASTSAQATPSSRPSAAWT